MPTPFFSICIPVYNMVSTVGQSIASVLAQTSDNWELVVIDNQSTDGTWEYISNTFAQDKRVQLLRNEANLGMRGNLNRCLDVCTGQWLGILPADDEYRAHCLQTIHAQVTKNSALVMWTHSHFVHGVDVKPNITNVYTSETHFLNRDIAELLYIKGNLFGELSSYFVRTTAFKRNEINFSDGALDVDLRFWIRVLKANPSGEFIYWPDSLASVWQHPASGSSTADKYSTYCSAFEMIDRLASLGWNRVILFRQCIRILKMIYSAGLGQPEVFRKGTRVLGSLLTTLTDSRSNNMRALT